MSYRTDNICSSGISETHSNAKWEQMLPEWISALIKVTAITITILLGLIYSVQGGQARANYYYSWSKEFDRFSARVFHIALPIQSAIILIFGGGVLPLWLYLIYGALSLMMACLLGIAHHHHVGILKLPLSLCHSEGKQLALQLLIAFIFVFFVMGAGIFGFIIAMKL